MNHYTIFMDLLISMQRFEGINEPDMKAAISQLSMEERDELRRRLVGIIGQLRPGLPELKLVYSR